MKSLFVATLLVALLILVATSAAVVVAQSQPPRSIFLSGSYFKKVAETVKPQILATIAQFNHNGHQNLQLPGTFVDCQVSYSSLQLQLPTQAPRMITTVVNSSAGTNMAMLIVAFPTLTEFNTSISNFAVKCAAASSLTAILSSTSGGFAPTLKLTQPLAWTVTISANATVIDAKMIPQVSAAFSAQYTTGTGFFLDAFVQSFFDSVTETIRSNFQTTLASIAQTPLTPVMTASMSVVQKSCAVESSAERSLVQFSLQGPNCSIDWSGLTPSYFFSASDVAMRMPYLTQQAEKDVSRGLLFTKTTSSEQCQSCCQEPCPAPLSLPHLPPMKFVGCAACFNVVETAAANVTFS